MRAAKPKLARPVTLPLTNQQFNDLVLVCGVEVAMASLRMTMPNLRSTMALGEDPRAGGGAAFGGGAAAGGGGGGSAGGRALPHMAYCFPAACLLAVVF